MRALSLRRFALLLAVFAFVASTCVAMAAGAYRGNISSRIFHDSGCRYFSCKNCSVEFATRQQAIAAGYRPCKVCKP